MKALRALGLLLVAWVTGFGANEVRLKPDEKIVFYPTVAERIPGQNAWRCEVRGWVCEPEGRGLWTVALRETLHFKNVEMTPAEEEVFNERARLFLVDHERGKKVFVRFGLKSVAVGKSKADGTFSGFVQLTDDEVRGSPLISFEAALPLGESRAFRGEAFALEETGLSVISDIDDTIKITEVRDRNATLRNTFLREFQPVPGMAEFYQRLARPNHAQFHYVSASPWQLYEPLAELVDACGFPPGTFTLKEFRWKSRSFLSFVANPEKYKSGVIEPLFKKFPKRRFILIGDSGERDPEVYAALARKFPQQVERIWIRDVTGEAGEADRYAQAFRDVPRERWQIFREPTELRFTTIP